ncbi:GntR family transcriptional regulator [Bacillus sp. AFS018417]|uniref:MocR-like pyridoxine biosynthesis transcription factor PdxR n=1 Tax=Bacillus sp. AFS018417 TaxID=2033491 RepID=UPI000BFAA198|nr:PLP-dependent aminotransferase family protein [Bacillus sp. AFS018417]PEZ06349.1 GntR family transcriptional regulator [Bacillus sp. AFS018417]
MLELTPKLDIHSKEPLYVQLYNYMKEEMKSGNVPPYTKLPSKRKLAQYLQISQNTIEAAYGQLVAEGYIEAIPRKGYFVCEMEQTVLHVKQKMQHVKEIPYYERDYVFDFTHTGVDAQSFPFALYRKLANEVLQIENEEVLLLGHPQGEFGLRKEIAKYMYESRGVHCSPSQIIIGAGTQYLIRMLFQLLKESTFAVENPGYHRRMVTYEKGIEHVEQLPLDEDGIMLSCLEESNADVVFVTPSHQFPCGMIMPISKRMQLLHWAEKEEGRYIVEDDYDSEFRYSGKPIPALQGLDTNGKVIYMSTFSKALLPSLRISYMVLPKALIEVYQQDYFFYTQTVSRIDQEIVKRFLEGGHWEKHIHKMRVVYRKKRDTLVSAISTYFPKYVEIIGQDSGLHILLRTNNGMAERELIERAAAYSIKVHPVSMYYDDVKVDNKTVLLGFAILSEEEIDKAVQLLAKAWFD